MADMGAESAQQMYLWRWGAVSCLWWATGWCEAAVCACVAVKEQGRRGQQQGQQGQQCVATWQWQQHQGFQHTWGPCMLEIIVRACKHRIRLQAQLIVPRWAQLNRV
jgi:hypothetical protein